MKLSFKLGSLFSVLAIFALVAGCKPATVSGENAFAKASPELKAEWQKASDAVKSNDYAGALLLLQDLQGKPGLTPEQNQAVAKTATAVSDRMYAAANSGDPKAKQALEDIRKARGR